MSLQKNPAPNTRYQIISYRTSERRSISLSVRTSCNNTHTQAKMLITHGKSDSLKKVHSILLERGITEFQSIKQVNQFIRDYNQRLRDLRSEASKLVEEEVESLRSSRSTLEDSHQLELQEIEDRMSTMLKSHVDRLSKHNHKDYDPLFRKIYSFFQRKYSKYKINKIEADIKINIDLEVLKHQEQIESIDKKILDYTVNTSEVVDQKIKTEVDRLEHIKITIEEINPLIAGAIGEHKVIKCLEELSEDGVLINDYNLSFKPPIFYRKDKTKIHSIQLDHLLITKAGLFILETKNWSKESIDNADLRSPVSQINRSSYALFRYLNDAKTIQLRNHHWGEKEISTRNVIVMINHKPSTKFKFVKIKTLNELNGYIEHFPDELTLEEMRGISEFLRKYQDTSVKTTKTTSPKLSSARTINEMYQDKRK